MTPNFWARGPRGAASRTSRTKIEPVSRHREWWRDAVVYQVYVRSFADGDGDGVGDIAGLRARLHEIAWLGVDAIWISPWYASPLADGGYDVSDHRSIHPAFGTLAEATAVLEDAHAHGLRVLLDIVPNHTSHAHPWFQAALVAGPGSPERARYVFRAGSGPEGAEPPNNWASDFGGGAWTRVDDGEWYLHLFDGRQPDLNWHDPAVRADYERTLRFWLDRGADGFRIDAASALFKADGLPDLVPENDVRDGRHPYFDRDELHDLYRCWRAIADEYDPPRALVGEVWIEDPARLARYLRADELHGAFTAHLLEAAWIAADLRAAIDATLTSHAAVGAAPSWVLANHDTARLASRLAREPGRGRRPWLDDILGLPADAEAGLRRARAAALIALALPGTVYLYQGEELGLPEVEDIPVEQLDDPTWERSGRTRRGRDGSRVPLPWSGDRPPYGFGVGGAWLPQPPAFAAHTRETLAADPDSVLNLYRAALRLRREHPALGGCAPVRWLDAPEGALAFARDPGLAVVANLAAAPVAPAGELLLASGPLAASGEIPPDTAVWLSV